MDRRLFAEAQEARLAGEYPLAMSLCEAYLGGHPADPEAESLLGLCQVECGDVTGAVLVERAAKAQPDNARLVLNMSILRERQGDLREAVTFASRAASLAPDQFEPWGQLGKLLGVGGKLNEASTALQRAFEINHRHAGIALLLAGAALESGELAVCQRAADAAEQSGAPRREILRIRAHLARRKMDWKMLEEVASQLLKADPKDEEARVALAHALSQQGYYRRACEIYAPLAGGATPRARHLAAMGRYKLGDRQLAEARSYFEQALAADPACAEAAFGLARYHLFLGDLSEAEAACRRALAAEPEHAEALGLLVEATHGRVTDNELQQISFLADRPESPPETRVGLLFAKGDALHRRGAADEAFSAWSAANAIKREQAQEFGHAYDPRREEETKRRLARLFSTDPREGAAFGEAETDGAPIPIFIVGMPRSGTTLLENALSAHRLVDGAGEVPALPFILSEFLDWAESSDWSGGDLPENKKREWRRLYTDQCARFGAAGAQFVTDKQPQNFLSVGLIRRLFPEARIIHIRRSPLETGFSIFRRNFTRHWSFATDLSDIGHYYGQYARVASHWARTLGEGLGFIQYENLVANFEGEVRRILDFCGLPWDEACLDFYKSERPVITFSASQVRKAPSKEHLNSTERYRTHLGPLQRALEEAGVDLDSGALLAEANRTEEGG